MLNKDNYIPWSSRLLRYAKNKPNEKLLTDDELTATEAKQVEANIQAIQTILMGLPEDIYAAVDSCNTTQEIWLCVQMMKGTYIGVSEKEAKLLNEFERYNAMQNEGNQVRQNTVQNSGIQNVRNQNEKIGVLGIANHNGNGNVIAVRVEGNGNGNNTNLIKCYNYRGMGHYARNYIVRPRRRDVAYLQTQLMIDQKEEAGIQHQVEEFDLMVDVVDCEEIEKVNDDSNVIHVDLIMDPSGGDLEQHPTTIEETYSKDFKDEIAFIVNQGDVRVIHFKYEFLKEAAKFVQDFKSLAIEASESLEKIKVLEKENECLLRAVVNEDILSIVQNHSVIDTLNL
ncbi:hypothetical protein Tco_0008306 [Tanacetum coccineum]